MAGTERMILQPRDRDLLKELALMRIADREQIRVVAGFRSLTRVNTRLLKLFRAGLLRRFFLGSGGGRKALYSLSERGARLVDLPARGPRKAQGAIFLADAIVEHQLFVNTIYCAVKFGAIPLEGVSFRRWVAFHESIAPELKLIPDGYFEFFTPDGVSAFFLEVDLGTESLSVWKEKTRQYLELARSGAYQRLFGQDRFRVLVAAYSERRSESIRKAVGDITEIIFRFSTLENAKARFFGFVWLRPLGNQSESLFEQQP